MKCPGCLKQLYPDSLIYNKEVRRNVENHIRNYVSSSSASQKPASSKLASQVNEDYNNAIDSSSKGAALQVDLDPKNEGYNNAT